MTDPIPAVPKRWWWTKRIVPVYAAFLLASLAGRWWWGHYANTRVQAEVDAIRARGEPLLAHEFVTPPIPDEQNAAVLLTRAVEALFPPDWIGFNMPSTPQDPRRSRLLVVAMDMADEQVRQEHPQELAELLELSTEAFAWVRRARALHSVDWQLDLSKGLMGMRWRSGMWISRDLSYLLCVAARAVHDQGDDKAAVEYLRDCLWIADSMETTPCVIGHVVGFAIRGYAIDAAEYVISRLQIGQEPGMARPESVRVLVQNLLDEQASRRGLLGGFIGENGWAFEMTEGLSDGRYTADRVWAFINDAPENPPVVQAICRYVTGPMWKLEQSRLLQYLERHTAAARADRYPVVTKLLPPPPAGVTGARSLTRLATSLNPWKADRTFLWHYRTVANSRMAAVALAMRLYEVDHGRRPEKLADLVPNYLPAVPDDPFSPAAGAPILYAPGLASPVLYSVSTNEVDDGGSFTLDSAGDVNYEQSLDLVFFLNGDRPAGPVEWHDPLTPEEPAPESDPVEEGVEEPPPLVPMPELQTTPQAGPT